jgi:hypothetical protein
MVLAEDALHQRAGHNIVRGYPTGTWRRTDSRSVVARAAAARLLSDPCTCSLSYGLSSQPPLRLPWRS